MCYYSWLVSIKLGKKTTVKRISRMVVLGFTLFTGKLSSHPQCLYYYTPISIAIYDTLGGELVYLVDENPKRLTEQFIKVFAEKQEAIIGGV